MELWVDKYAPSCKEQLLGNGDVVKCVNPSPRPAAAAAAALADFADVDAHSPLRAGN